jgi:hypothetical protein
MPEHVHAEDDTIVNPETHHEKRDVNVRILLWLVIVFIVIAAVSHVLIWIMFKYFRDLTRAERSAPLTAIARPAGADVPSLPRLQPFPTADQKGTVMPPYTSTPVTDLKEMRAAEEEALHNPGWIDQQKGIVRLPIDLAKELVVKQGLPVVGSKQ